MPKSRRALGCFGPSHSTRNLRPQDGHRSLSARRQYTSAEAKNRQSRITNTRSFAGHVARSGENADKAKGTINTSSSAQAAKPNHDAKRRRSALAYVWLPM